MTTGTATTPSIAAVRNRAWWLLAFLGAAAVVGGSLLVTRYVYAIDIGAWIAENIIAPIIMLLVGFVGQLLLMMVSVLISIAQYNDFVNSTAVANGWIIVRDLTNMFFILVLLILAFGTMLGIEGYSYKNRMLPRLLIMAVVINFSRTICGLLIDFGQVVMLTFVNGFAQAAGGNFVEALGIKDLLEPGERRGGVSGWDIVIALLFALAIVTISLGVIIIMICTLVIRIIYLWLLVILSPIAFFMKAVPGGKASGYYAEWWSMFTSNIVTGPILAFFLWLSLVSVASGGVSQGFPDPNFGEEVKAGASKSFSQVNIQGYIISIALLIGGVMMAQKAGGAGVGLGKSIALGAGKAVARGAKSLGKGAWDRTGGRVVDYGKEQALRVGVASGIPGVSTAAGRALGGLRAEKAAKAAEASAFVGQLRPEEAARFASSKVPMALMSTEQKAIQKEALRATLKGDAAKIKPGDEKAEGQFRERMATFSKLGSATNDKSVVGDLSEIQKSRPDLIVDPKADAATLAAQQGSFNRVVGGMSARDVGKLNPAAMRDEVLAQINPKVLQKALESSDTGTTQRKALEDYAKKGGLDANSADFKAMKPEQRADAIIAAISKQQDADKKARPDLISDQSERERIIQGMTKDEVQGLNADTLSTAMVAALASRPDFGELNVDMSKFKLDTNQLTNNRDMAAQIAVGIGDKMKDMPKDIAQALRTGLKDSKATAEQKLTGGVAVKDVFKSLDTNTGTFGKRDEKNQFDAAMAKMTAGQAARAVGAVGMSDRGGKNELAISVMNKMDVASLQKMAKDGGSNQDVFAAIQAAKGLTKADQGKATDAYLKSLPKDMDSGEKGMALSKFTEEFKNAQKNAQNIVGQLNDKKSTLSGDVRDIKFTVASKAGKVAGAAALVAAAPGAVATGAAVAGIALGLKKLNDKRNAAGVNWEAVKREVGAAVKSTVRETSRGGRAFSRIIKK